MFNWSFLEKNVKPISMALIVLLLAFLVVLLILMGQRKSASVVSSADALVQSFQFSTPGQEELFLLDEPSYLPTVILFREPQGPWSEEDVQLYWTDPKLVDGDFWQDQIRQSADSILEAAP